MRFSSFLSVLLALLSLSFTLPSLSAHNSISVHVSVDTNGDDYEFDVDRHQPHYGHSHFHDVSDTSCPFLHDENESPPSESSHHLVGLDNAYAFSLDILLLDRNFTHYHNGSALTSFSSEDKAPLWEEILSGAINVIPLVGTAKSAVELFTGEDLITHQHVPRWASALGVVAGALPCGKMAETLGLKVMTLLGEKAGVEGVTGALRAVGTEYPLLAKELPSMLKAAAEEGWAIRAEQFAHPTATILQGARKLATKGFLITQGLRAITVVGREEWCRHLSKDTLKCLGYTRAEKSNIVAAQVAAKEAGWFDGMGGWVYQEWNALEDSISSWFSK